MRHCPSCHRTLTDDSRFCSACGEDLLSVSSAPTRTPSTSSGSGLLSVSSISGGGAGSRFIPGTILAGRYRLIGPLGRGGMGEVYRADDLKLGQAVALKFLPEKLADDPDRLARFYAEVRVARQITHPNVCRVYDIGEVDGQHFISMEYVDGEDLSSLLRRIGRLPETKALQVARQLCAGMAAAHEQGILHRDLKPANVMIDGQGRVRITDFGLAAFAGDVAGAEARAGTPVYMAPEQLRGEEVSVRSDIYALGLVMYELLTGEAAHRGRSLPALIEEQRTPQTSPSTLVDGIDPSVEKVILRCLERDPDKRPGSALSVAAALPGGDPLAAALAAGETPSPEMVAAVRREGGLKPWLAVVLLAVFLAGLIAQIFLQREVLLVHQVNLPKRPEVLQSESREVLGRLGYEAGQYSVTGLSYDGDFIQKMQDPAFLSSLGGDFEAVRPAPVHFWYRQGNTNLVAENGVGWVTQDDPSLQEPGMILVELDPDGRLLRFAAVPSADEEHKPGKEPDWGSVFRRAGLHLGDFQEDGGEAGIPPIFCQGVRAWKGTRGEEGLQEIRVLAGWYGGRVNYFRLLSPWNTVPGAVREESQDSIVLDVAGWLILGMIVVGGLALARRNLARGRGDRKGALRLALFVVGVSIAAWALRVDHVLGSEELLLVRWSLASSLLLGLCVWLLYVALEPYIRRFWPDTIVSWSRILAGRIGDSLVGRDVLVGATSGAVLGTLQYLSHLASATYPAPDPPVVVPLESLLGLRQGLSLLGNTLNMSVLNPLALLLLILLLNVLLRRQWLAVSIVYVGFVLLSIGQEGATVANCLFAIVVWGLAVGILVRYGLVSSIAMFYVAAFTSVFPFPEDLSAWYSSRALFLFLLIAGAIAYSFYLSLGGRRLFHPDFLEP